MSGAPPAFADALRDRYVLERELGRGGMATVYLARDLRHDRPVALKVLHADLARALGQDRFLREIRTAARLQHPHILSVHDSGEAAGRLWFTMPYVEGESLRHRLARERQLPLSDAIRITTECARALDHAHLHGVIHRDIKPENILLTADGSTLVADFGIAKAEGGDNLTDTGLVMGTPAYMSPEQSAGHRALDARTDVYSLACVLYEMLAGEPPYVGSTAQAVIAKRLTEPVPRLTTLRQVPAGVERAVTTALARSPADRFSTAGELAVAVAESAGPAAAERPRRPVPAPRQARGRLFLRRAAAVAAAMAIGGSVAWLLLSRPWESSRADSVAVLPFANLSPGPGDEYFSDGIAEELITALGRVEGLRVAARTSAFAFKGRNPDLAEIRQRLGVETVLEGSVRRAGERVRVTAQLVDARDGHQLWSDAFERDARDVFAVQQELSQAIAVALRGRLAAASGAGVRTAPDADAYDLYLRGRHAWRRRTWEGLLKARDLLEQAIARDPGFAPAHAGLADVYVVMSLWSDVPPGETYPRAKAAALQALALDSTLAEPHATLGDVHAMYEWNWEAAEREFKRALALDPHSANSWHWYGGDYLSPVGRAEEAIAAVRRARELDPLSPTINAGVGITLYREGRYQEALEHLEAVRSLDPDFVLINSGLGEVQLIQGKYQEAVATLERAVDPAVRHSMDLALLGAAYTRAGRRPDAVRLLRELEERGARGYVSRASVALLHAALGDSTKAFQMLERAAELQDPFLIYYFVRDPLAEGLRRDRRGVRLVQRMGLSARLEDER